MKFTKFEREINDIRTKVENTTLQGMSLKIFLREQLHKIGELLIEYSNPYLTDMKSKKQKQSKQQKSKKNSTINIFSKVHNCPDVNENTNDLLLLENKEFPPFEITELNKSITELTS